MIDTVRIILVRPTFSGNLGASARAAANFGVNRIILIEPKCEVDESARQAAAGAQDWLKKIDVFSNWADFLSQDRGGYRIALSRRKGKRRLSQELDLSVREVAKISRQETALKPLDLIFGPEAEGLSAEDLQHANRVASLPVPGPFASLNLSQAVLLALFITQQNIRADSRPLAISQQTESIEEVRGAGAFPDPLLRRWLTSMGFSLEKRKMSAYLVMRRLFMRSCPTDYELHVLNSVLQQSTRKQEEFKELRALQKDSALLKEISD